MPEILPPPVTTPALTISNSSMDSVFLKWASKTYNDTNIVIYVIEMKRYINPLKAEKGTEVSEDSYLEQGNYSNWQVILKVGLIKVNLFA